MRLSDYLDEVKRHGDALLAAVEEANRFLKKARDVWPDHQIVGPVVWQAREVTPPAGVVWASDGLGVWLIHTDGGPISAGATAVQFWTTAYIPAPPVVMTIDGEDAPC